MDLPLDKNEMGKKQKIQKERRSFLKKSVYAAPTLLALGTLTKPTESNAFTRPPSSPAWPNE